jgi:hypothetical protein
VASRSRGARKKEAHSGGLEITRSAKDAAWAPVDLAKEANWRANLDITTTTLFGSQSKAQSGRNFSPRWSASPRLGPHSNLHG